MKKNSKRAAAALCSCTLLAAGLAGCSGNTQEELMDITVTVEVQNVTRGSIELQGTYVGSVSAGESVNVIPLVQGANVDSVNVAVGSEVKEGQVLAELDSTSADLSAESAQAAYNSALASAQSALGGQWNTSIYSAERGIDQLNETIDNLNDQIDDLEDTKDDAKKARDAAKAYCESLTGAAQSLAALSEKISIEVTEQNQELSPVKDAQKNIGDTIETKLGETSISDLSVIANLKNGSGMDDTTRKNVIALAEYAKKDSDLKNLTQENIEKAAEAYQTAESSYQSAKQTIDSSIDQLETQRDSYETQRDTAEGTLDITQSQTYQDTVNSLQAALAQAQVGLDSAAYQQSLYTLTSPIDGVVESVGLVKDSLASASSIAFTISNKDTMTVTFYVAEDVRDELADGQAVTVSRGSNTYSGVVTEIGNSVDLTKGLFKVKATIYDMPELASGVTASITTTCHRAANVVTIPCDAVYYENGDAYVFVARDGVAVKTPVETGIYNDTDIAVTSGLLEGQQVITSWSANLMDGAQITIPGQDAEQEQADEQPADSAASEQG